jgi:hypothetical protein
MRECCDAPPLAALLHRHSSNGSIGAVLRKSAFRKRRWHK